MQVNKFIDHTLLKAFATSADIKKLCDEAVKYDLSRVCISVISENGTGSV